MLRLRWKQDMQVVLPGMLLEHRAGGWKRGQDLHYMSIGEPPPWRTQIRGPV